MFLRGCNDLRRIRPVCQIDAQNITAIADHFLHLIVLRSLRICSIHNGQTDIISPFFQCPAFPFKIFQKFPQKGISLVITCDTNINLFRYFLFFASTCTIQKNSHQTN